MPALGHGWVLETQNQYRVGGEEVLAVARASTRRCSPGPHRMPGDPDAARGVRVYLSGIGPPRQHPAPVREVLDHTPAPAGVL